MNLFSLRKVFWSDHLGAIIARNHEVELKRFNLLYVSTVLLCRAAISGSAWHKFTSSWRLVLSWKLNFIWINPFWFYLESISLFLPVFSIDFSPLLITKYLNAVPHRWKILVYWKFENLLNLWIEKIILKGFENSNTTNNLLMPNHLEIANMKKLLLCWL